MEIRGALLRSEISDIVLGVFDEAREIGVNPLPRNRFSVKRRDK